MRTLFTIAFLLIATAAGAQTTNTIQWEYLNETLVNVTAMGQKVFVDGMQVVTAPTCVQNAANVNCSVAIPALSAGAHSVRVDATLNGVTKSTSISGINPTNAPKDPSNFRYTITVNVNVTG